MNKALDYLLSRPLLATQAAVDAAEAIVLRLDIQQVKAREGRPMDGTGERVERRGSVAVIDLIGPMFRYADWFVDLCGGVTVEALSRDLATALDDPAVSSIVMHFDTPGGEAAGIGELADMIRSGSTRKPIVAYVSNEACSAGYWLASACSEIVVASSARLGSIGTVMGYTEKAPNAGEKRYKWVSSQSPLKHADPSSESGNAEAQKIVDEMTDVFLGAVAEYRDTTPERVASDFGRGGTLLGQKAIDAGMADRLGSFESLVTELNEAARDNTMSRYGAAVGAAVDPVTITSQEEEETVNWKDIKKWMGHGMPDEFDPATAGEPPLREAATATLKPATIDLGNSPEIVAMKAELAALQASKKRADDERIDALATAFVQNEFMAGRVLPAETTALKATFVQCAQDDAASPLATGSRVQNLKDLTSARPKHSLFQEQITAEQLPDGFRLIGQHLPPAIPDPSNPMTDEQINAMLAKLPAGMQLLEWEKSRKIG